MLNGHIEHEAEVISMLAMTALFFPSHTTGSNDLFSINGPYWSRMFELVANAMYVSIRPLLNDLFLVSILTISGLMLVAVSIHHGTLDRGVNWGAWSLLGGLSRSIFWIFMGLFSIGLGKPAPGIGAIFETHIRSNQTYGSCKHNMPL